MPKYNDGKMVVRPNEEETDDDDAAVLIAPTTNNTTTKHISRALEALKPHNITGDEEDEDVGIDIANGTRPKRKAARQYVIDKTGPENRIKQPSYKRITMLDYN